MENDDLPLSVDVSLPEDVEKLIARRVAQEEGEVWSTIIHDALWQMRTGLIGRDAAQAELQAELLEACTSPDRGESVEITPEWWDELRARVADHSSQIAKARADGLLGNLLLPDALHRFVTEQVASGRFASASDVVSAAVRSCSR